jgi:ankyrin repeat protein
MNLMRASAKGDLETVKKLLNEGSDVNAADNNGRTALHEAAWGGKTDVVKLLIEKGVSVNAADSSGYTAIMRAAEEGHAAVVAQLIQAGADINVRGRVRGTTPLMLAAENGHIKVIQILIDNKVKINAIDLYEETALARAYRTNQTKAAELIEANGGRGKPERSTVSYTEKDLKSYTKATLPEWSAAASESNFEEEEPTENFDTEE